MKNMIYRNETTTTFAAAFAEAAISLSTKLNFTTREEYLEWVKQWKAAYKLVEKQHRIDTYCYRRDHCITESKSAYYQKKLDAITDPNLEEKTRYSALMTNMRDFAGMKEWFSDSYWLVIYMLVLRKAGKIKAKAQRNARVLELATVA